MLLGNPLEVGGVVRGGEGVLLASELGNHLGKGPVRMLGRAFEHKMLKEVRHAGLAFRLVGRSGLVPDHMGDHRSPVVGDNHDLKAVLEREVTEVRRDFQSFRRLGRSNRFRRMGGQTGSNAQKASQAQCKCCQAVLLFGNSLGLETGHIRLRFCRFRRPLSF